MSLFSTIIRVAYKISDAILHHDQCTRHSTVKSSAWNPDVALELMCTKLAINSSPGHHAVGDSTKFVIAYNLRRGIKRHGIHNLLKVMKSTQDIPRGDRTFSWSLL